MIRFPSSTTGTYRIPSFRQKSMNSLSSWYRTSFLQFGFITEVMESLTDASLRNPLLMSPSVTDPNNLPTSSTTNKTLETTPISSRMARACLTTALLGNMRLCQLCMTEVEKFFDCRVELSNFLDLFQYLYGCVARTIRV